MSSAMQYRQSDGMMGPTPTGIGEVDPALMRFVRGMYARGKVERFDLRHIELTRQQTVWSWDAEQLEGKEPEVIANDIWMSAEDQAKQIRGTVRWACVAYINKDPNVAAGRYLFRMSNEQQDFDEGTLDGEPASAAGMVAQSMRHTEACMRMAIGVSYDNARMLRDDNLQLRQQLQGLVPMQVRTMTLIQDLLDRQADRDMAIAARKSEEERKLKMMSLAMNAVAMLMPIVMKKLMGATDAEVGTMLGEEQVSSLLETLKPEQMMIIAKHLDATQQAALMELYRMYRERTKKRDGETTTKTETKS